MADPPEDDLQRQLLRALHEYAPRHPASLNEDRAKNAGGWSIAVQGLGVIWTEAPEAPGGPSVVTCSDANKGIDNHIRWRFEDGDYDSLREAVSRAVAYLLRAAPPEVRNL